MPTKVYLLINMDRELDQKGYFDAFVDLEALPEVKSIERVDGCCDLLVTAEAPIRAILVANKISAKDWVKDLRILKVMPFESRGTLLQNRDLTALASGTRLGFRVTSREQGTRGAVEERRDQKGLVGTRH